MTAAVGKVSIKEQASCLSTTKVAPSPALQRRGDIVWFSMQMKFSTRLLCVCAPLCEGYYFDIDSSGTLGNLCISDSIALCGHQHDSSYSQLLYPICKSVRHELICRFKICPTCLEMMMKTIKNKAQVVQQHHKVYAYALTKQHQSAK